MRVLLTGGTGYIGSATLDALVAAEHDVTCLIRDRSRRRRIEERGGRPAAGDVTDAAAVRALAGAVDGVVHLASPGDDTSAHVDAAFTDAVLTGLAGTGKAFVSTGGVWDHGSGDDITESSPFRPPRISAWGPAITERVRAATGVRTAVIAPALVYGRGDNLLTLVSAGPRRGAGDDEALVVPGGGDQHWPTVHVDDLADLYVQALENAPAGSYFIGASGVNPTAGEITRAASRALGLDGRIALDGLAATVGRLGALGEALLLDQRASGDGARRVLGWRPGRPTVLDHLAETVGRC